MQQMSAEWSFYHPVRVVSTRLSSYLASISGKSLLLVTTEGFTRRGLTCNIVDWAGKNKLQIYDHVRPNPDLDELDLALASLRGQNFDYILAVGGGSVIDAAKAFSIAVSLPIERPLSAILRENLSVDFSRRIPVIAVPTTSGTGSEVTQYATLWDLTNGLKYSLAGEQIFPQTAVLDFELSLSLPRQETLYTGLDAVSHA
ncbi:MAG: Iron-containing alcohol dehydrogenase, partial [uncultured bacterium]